MKEITELGIASKISRHSHLSGDAAYLEEDFDAALFADAKMKADPSWNVDGNVTYHESGMPSSIRDLPPYSPPAGPVSGRGGPEVAV